MTEDEATHRLCKDRRTLPIWTLMAAWSTGGL